MKLDQHCVNSLAKERDRNQFLQIELTRLENLDEPQSCSNESAQSRSNLRDLQMQLSDYRVENADLRNQVDTYV